MVTVPIVTSAPIGHVVENDQSFVLATGDATPRRLADYLQGLTASAVTPEQFGAVGDGVADDTVALQNALNAAANGTLYLTQKYLVSASIIWAFPCKIIGDGARRNGSVILAKSTMSATADILRIVPDSTLTRGTMNAWSISDMFICGQGNEETLWNGSMPAAGGRDAIAIEPVYAVGSFVPMFAMRDCTISGIARRCISLNVSGGNDKDTTLMMRIEHCFFQSGPLSDMVLNFTNCEDNTIITHCKIAGSGHGIVLKPQSGVAECAVTHCNITSNGVLVYVDGGFGGSQIKLLYNQLEHTQAFFGAGAENCCVYANTGVALDIIGCNFNGYTFANCIRLVNNTTKTVIRDNLMQVDASHFHLVLDADAGVYNNFGGGNRYYTSGLPVVNARVSDATAGAGLNRVDGLFTPGTSATTPTSTIGAFTSVVASTKYYRFGQVVFLEVGVSITTNGTAAGSITVTLPFAMAAAHGSLIGGRDSTNVLLRGYCSGTTCVITKYDGTYSGGDGVNLVLTGMVMID